MSDVNIEDPNRILIKTPIGDVQAWAGEAGDTSVAMGWHASVAGYGKSKTAWSNQSLYLSVADARALAAALIEAADHADRVRIASASDLGLEAVA